jgi:hypothetical protein
VDAAGNVGATVTSQVVTFDNTADAATAATLVVADTQVSNAEKGAVSFTVSNLDADATGVANFTQNGNTISVALTGGDGIYAANLSSFLAGPVTSSLSISDTSGNAMTRAGSSLTMDYTAPSITSVVISDSAIKIGDTVNVVITMSEAVNAFDNTSITANGGTLGTFSSTDGVTWTAAFTATANLESATNAVTVNAKTFTDIAGKSASLSATSTNYAIDVKRPVVASVSMDDTDLNVGDTAVVTIVFSEAVTGFDVSDLSAPSGSLSNLQTSDNITWTATFTAAASTTALTNIVTVSSAYADTATNAASSGLTSANYTVDTVVPTVALSGTMTTDAGAAGTTDAEARVAAA